LEVTFKAADFTEQIQSFVMSGPNASFNFTVPFNPAFVAVNMGEKISHAVAPEYKVLKTTGTTNFANARMSVSVLSITDSAFVRVEHNYTAPDGFHVPAAYRLSPNRYWKVDGILPPDFKAKATMTYDGRSGTTFSGTYWLDTPLNITTEDSLVLLYRRNTADDWHLYPYYTKNVQTSITDKRGIITIDSLQLGEYAFAISDYLAVGIHAAETTDVKGIKVYPNPSKTNLTVDLSAIKNKLEANPVIIVSDMSGRTLLTQKITNREESCKINTSDLGNGVYFITVRSGDKSIIAKNKFIVSH